MALASGNFCFVLTINSLAILQNPNNHRINASQFHLTLAMSQFIKFTTEQRNFVYEPNEHAHSHHHNRYFKFRWVFTAQLNSTPRFGSRIFWWIFTSISWLDSLWHIYIRSQKWYFLSLHNTICTRYTDILNLMIRSHPLSWNFSPSHFMWCANKINGIYV